MGCVRDLHFWLQDKRHYGLFTRNYTLCKPSQSQIKSLWDIHNMPTRSKFTFFQVFLNFWSNAPKCCSLGGGGGVCVCFPKSVRKGHFRNVWVGSVTIFLSTEAELFSVSGFFGPPPDPLTRAGHQLTGFPLGAPTYCGVGAK